MKSLKSNFREEQCNTCIHGRLCVKKSVYDSVNNMLNTDAYFAFTNSMNIYFECIDYIPADALKGVETICKE